MLLHKLSCPKARLLLGVLMLKDARRNYYAIPGVDIVVSHESRHFADDGQEALFDQLHHPFRVGNALVAPHRNVHRFGLPPSHREGGAINPALGLMSGVNCEGSGYPEQLRRTLLKRPSENAVNA